MRHLLALIMVFSLSCLTARAENLPTRQTEEETPVSKIEIFEHALNERMESGQLVGLAYALVRKGELVRLETMGVAEFGKTRPIGPTTRFRIASLSKGFAGTLTAGLIRDNKLSLNTPLSLFRPDFRLKTAAAEAIRIEHILTHRLGLPPNAYDNLIEAGLRIPVIEKRLASVAPICKPGTCYSYQNVTYDLIVDVIEAIEGLGFETVVKQRLFDPLGMQHSSFGAEALMSDPDWARPHRRKQGEAWRTLSVKPDYYQMPAAAGINTSITDMAVWLQAQLGNRPDIVDPETLEILHTPRTQTLSETRRKKRRMPHLTASAYALGWRIYTYSGETVITHSGAVAGYAAMIVLLPQKDTGLVILSNANTRAFHEILPLFLDLELNITASPS